MKAGSDPVTDQPRRLVEATRIRANAQTLPASWYFLMAGDTNIQSASQDAYQKLVGHEVGVSSWHLVDQRRIDVYADVIEDHQFIHVDPERAKKETAFGNTIAHGFLTMSLMSIMSYEVMPVIEGTAMGVNYGFDKLRFLSPVRAGSRVRGRFTLMEAKLRKPKELQSRTNVTVEIEGEEKPALVADWIGLIYFA